MKLSDSDADVLAHIAVNTTDTLEDIAESLDRPKRSVQSTLSRLREHSLVVHSPGRRVERTEEYELYIDDDYPEWMITGRGKRHLDRYVSRIIRRALTLSESLSESKVYRPPHVWDAYDASNRENDGTNNGGD